MSPSRTVALGLLLGLSGAAVAASQAEARSRHREAGRSAVAPSVTVDVSRLRAIGVGEYAEIVGSAVEDELAKDGAAAPPGGRLVVRLTGLSLPSYAGSDGGSGGGGGGGGSGGAGGNFDYLEGEILVVGARGEIISQRPQTASISSSSGGAYYLPGFDRRRAEAIARTFAAWVRRSL